MNTLKYYFRKGKMAFIKYVLRETVPGLEGDIEENEVRAILDSGNIQYVRRQRINKKITDFTVQIYGFELVLEVKSRAFKIDYEKIRGDVSKYLVPKGNRLNVIVVVVGESTFNCTGETIFVGKELLLAFLCFVREFFVREVITRRIQMVVEKAAEVDRKGMFCEKLVKEVEATVNEFKELQGVEIDEKMRWELHKEKIDYYTGQVHTEQMRVVKGMCLWGLIQGIMGVVFGVIGYLKLEHSYLQKKRFTKLPNEFYYPSVFVVLNELWRSYRRK